jgi:pimeloyl-ACP methyl ester carboxylesterase
MTGPTGAEFRSVWTEVHGLPIHAKVSTPPPEADRPPLVLVHGLALSHRYMRSWLWQFIRWRQNNRYNPPELGPISWHDYRRAGYLRAQQSCRLALKDRIEDKLPRVAAPSLVVRGQCDPICRPAWAAEVARLLPHGQLVEIPDVAHTLVYTAPEQLAAVTRRFLSDGGSCR